MNEILEPNELDPALMRHACLAAIGFLNGMSILDKDGIIATLKEAVTTRLRYEIAERDGEGM